MLRIAVIGAGRIGKVHAATVAAHPQAQLVLVCDPVLDAAKALAEPHGARASVDPNDAFTSDDVDAVVIGSPTPLHREHVLAAARAGKAALCEKPVAASVEEAKELAAELDTFEHPPVMVGFQRRFDPSIAKAQRLGAEGRIGRIEQLSIISRDPAPPSAEYLAVSGGVFKDMVIHDFDEARFFLGEITHVTAIGQKLDPVLAHVDDFDGAVTMLQAASGAVAVIKNTRHCATGYDQRVELFGSEGEVMVENLRATSVRVNDAHGSDQEEVYLDFFLTRYAEAYRDELTAFIDAINSGSPVSPTVEDGVLALVLAEAAERSARTGTTVEVER